MGTQLTKGIISIEMDNVLPEETKKLESYFVRLIHAQIHRFGPGKIILHFDKDKNLRRIERRDFPWTG